MPESQNNGPSVPEEKLPWYFKMGTIVTAFMFVGPLALPLVWLHPKMTVSRKILLTVLTAVLTYFMVGMTIESIKKVTELYSQMKTQYGL